MHYLFNVANNKKVLITAKNEAQGESIFVDYLTALNAEKTRYPNVWSSVSYHKPTIYESMRDVEKSIKTLVDNKKIDHYLGIVTLTDNVFSEKTYIYKYQDKEDIAEFVKNATIEEIHGEKETVEEEINRLQERLSTLNLAVTMFEKGEKSNK